MKSQMTLNRKKLENYLPLWGNRLVMAKDHGAYICGEYCKEKKTSYPIYFKGCDPTKSDDWYDYTHLKFGGDDFGIDLSDALEAMREEIKNPKFHSAVIKFNNDTGFLTVGYRHYR